MPTIELDHETYERLMVVARLMNEPVGAVVRRLVDRLATAPDTSHTPEDVDMANRAAPKKSAVSTPSAATPTDAWHGDEWIPVHKIYKGHRIEGTFNAATHELHLSTEPWANKYFASPTAAAVAVVEHFSGNVRETPNTNGRLFWKVTKTGRNLRSIIGER